jgi:hypothetical protein
MVGGRLRLKQLNRLLELASSASLGASLLLAWTYVLYRAGLSCPSWDCGHTVRALVLPLGYWGALLWAFLISAPLAVARKFPWLAAPALALALTLALADPLPLALASVAALPLLGAGMVLEALPAGTIAVELAVLAGSAARAYDLRLPLPPALPIHLALYCPLVPAVPALAFLACLSPLLAPLAPKGAKLSAPYRGKLLVPSLLASFLMWSVVYASALNPGSKLVGVDAITRYYPHALKLLEGGLPSVLKVGYDRPLHYFLLYALAKALGPYDAVRALALIPFLLYTLASYLLARELWGGRIAGLAAAVAPLTYTATAGLFGGLYGNWTALALALLACTAAVKWLRGGSAAWLLLYLLLLVAVAGVHVYMGAVAFAALSLFLLLAARKGYRRRALAALALQVVVAAVGLYAAERYLSALGARGPFSVTALNVNLWLKRAASTRLFSEEWWYDFCFAVYRYAPSTALDPLVWLLTTLATAMLGFKDLGGLLLAPWMALTALLTFTAPSSLIYRSLLDFPYSIAEAVGLAYLTAFIEERWGGGAAKLWAAALLLFKLSFALAFAVGLAS